jgi:hypothetical protein
MYKIGNGLKIRLLQVVVTATAVDAVPREDEQLDEEDEEDEEEENFELGVM